MNGINYPLIQSVQFGEFIPPLKEFIESAMKACHKQRQDPSSNNTNFAGNHFLPPSSDER
ncbi:MAG: hypothetical protein ONB05_05105 [candidate division KSB1 bacterium]|nr:hypothetical protein [candidate division KSB1 bacterium]